MQTGNHFSSFNHVQQDNHHPKQSFSQVLKGYSAQLTGTQTDQLQALLYSFPQCGLLHAVQARSGNAVQINKAAAWFGTSHLLQKVVTATESLQVVNAIQIIFKDRTQPKSALAQQVVTSAADVSPAQSEPVIAPAGDVKIPQPIVEPEPKISVIPEDAKFAPPIFREEPMEETQKLIIENIAANDYFIFDKAFNDRNHIEPEVIEPESLPKEKPHFTIAKPAEEGSVTRYHDDKMPYSFLWWLDKTRSKHSQVYQPFAKPAANEGTVVDIADNHVKEVLDERTKEEEIVERFIQEEPQMRPPSGDKLDSENKAKNSVEDQEELITETLARIYADQMLYSKAIAAYKILILKNPEKRRYFASQIEILEKKIN